MKITFYTKAISVFIAIAFILTSINCPIADADRMPQLPAPGVMVDLSSRFNPAIIRGMTIDAKNPFALSFLVDPGEDKTPPDEQKAYYQKLIKYFLAAMTIAEDKQWVNLSPYEKNRIIDIEFGKTSMGRDLLAEDYLLKQITSSLLHPEGALGKEFWQRIYQQSGEKYKTTQIPVNTFNKVWILPETASVYEKDNSVLIVSSKLRVMLEEDYLSLQKHSDIISQPQSTDIKGVNKLGSQMMQEIILPALEKEVNEGKNFAQLRQIYHGMVLATWYKQALKRSILTQIYANKNKVSGVDLPNPKKSQQEIYQQYLKAFKKGVYNFIKEEQDPISGQVVPRKYFAGGFERGRAEIKRVDGAMASQLLRKIFGAAGLSGLLAVSALLLPATPALAQQNPSIIKVTMDYRKEMSFQAIDRRIDEIPPESRPGIQFALPEIKVRGSPIVLYVKMNSRVGAVGIPHVTAFSAFEGNVYMAYLDDKTHQPAYVKFTQEEGVRNVTDASRLPPQVRKEFGIPVGPEKAQARFNYKTMSPADFGKRIREIPQSKHPQIVLKINAIGELDVTVREKGFIAWKVIAIGADNGQVYIWELEDNNKPTLAIIKPDGTVTTAVKSLEDLLGDKEMVRILGLKPSSDQAQVAIQSAARQSDLGGIDLNSANLNLKIRRDGNGVPLPLTDQDPAMLTAQGFIPVIVGIKSAEGLPILSELKNFFN